METISKYYGGVGSRETPSLVLSEMTLIASKLGLCGYTLRSGGAIGADSAFESGAKVKEIFRPNDATTKSIELASKHHPAWSRCKRYVKMLHGRNAQIVLGRNLDAPIEFLVCWTPGAKDVGGTGLTIRLARAHNVCVYNLFLKQDVEDLNEKYGLSISL